jgi:hypothetical protein
VRVVRLTFSTCYTAVPMLLHCCNWTLQRVHLIETAKVLRLASDRRPACTRTAQLPTHCDPSKVLRYPGSLALATLHVPSFAARPHQPPALTHCWQVVDHRRAGVTSRSARHNDMRGWAGVLCELPTIVINSSTQHNSRATTSHSWLGCGTRTSLIVADKARTAHGNGRIIR